MPLSHRFLHAHSYVLVNVDLVQNEDEVRPPRIFKSNDRN